MSGPEVSVVIPTFERPATTARAIRSVLRQAEVPTEIVVVDDASSTPFRLPHDLYGSGARVLRLERNGGPAAARNAGVAASAAPAIAFLDSDDFWMPDTLAPRLRRLREAVAAERPTMLCAAVWRWRPGEGAAAYRPVPAEDVATMSAGCWYFPGSTGLFTRKTWELVGPLDDRMRRLEDLDWGIRLARAGGRLAVAPEVAAVVERSGRAGLARVEHAASLIREGVDVAADGAASSNLRAYLALEQASSALGEGRYGLFLRQLAASLLARPRLRLHLDRWWQIEAGTPAQVAFLEAMARSLERSSEAGN